MPSIGNSEAGETIGALRSFSYSRMGYVAASVGSLTLMVW